MFTLVPPLGRSFGIVSVNTATQRDRANDKWPNGVKTNVIGLLECDKQKVHPITQCKFCLLFPKKVFYWLLPPYHVNTVKPIQGT